MAHRDITLTTTSVKPLKIALFHGGEMQGSGSNEYVRYLSKALANMGHTVHVLCRDPNPSLIPHVSRVFNWDTEGENTESFVRKDIYSGDGTVIVHVLPHASVRPVILTDKQRVGNVKAFGDLTDEELKEYHDLCVKVVGAILDAHPIDIMYSNHIIYQPIIAADTCKPRGIPFIIFPHGSAIEYVVRDNDKFLGLARYAINKCDQLISGSREVRDRILGLYPDMHEEILSKCQIVGVGVDTSLFKPVDYTLRKETIEQMINVYMKNRADADTIDSTDPMVIGKTPELVMELTNHLDEGNIEVVKEYAKSGYNHDLPDSDIVEKLTSINWDAPVMFFVGALTAGKGVQSLLMALPRIFKHIPDVQLIIVGAGAYREGLEAFQHALATGNADLLSKLVELGFDLDSSPMSGSFIDIQEFLKDDEAKMEVLTVGEKIKTNVKFLGRINHDLLKYIFPCVDIATFPSVVPEAYPLVLMESLSNGVLPLVSNFSGFKDGLDELERLLGSEWVANLRIPNESSIRVSEIAKNINAALGNSELKVLGPRLRDIAVKHYDWSTRAIQITDALYKTLGK